MYVVVSSAFIVQIHERANPFPHVNGFRSTVINELTDFLRQVYMDAAFDRPPLTALFIPTPSMVNTTLTLDDTASNHSLWP